MFRIDNSTAATSLAAHTAAGTAGYFTDGNPATGTPATIVPAEWLNTVMLEIDNVITGAGLTLNKAVDTQLYTAVTTLAAAGSSGALLKANNLSDLNNAATARANLGLGALATLNTVNNGNWSGAALAVANGGTGATTASAARAALSAAASGANGDITSLTGLTTALSVAQGGTGATTAAAARTALSAAASGANTDITSITGSAATLTTSRSIAATGDATWSVNFNGAAGVTAALTIANGAVTLAKMANLATATFVGRHTAGTGVPEALTAAQAAGLLDLALVLSGTQNLASDGHIKIGDLIVNWGKYAGGSSNPTISFDLAFPTACFGVWPCAVGTGAGTDSVNRSVRIVNLDGDPTTSGFTVYCTSEDTSPDTFYPDTGVNFFWVAIGK